MSRSDSIAQPKKAKDPKKNGLILDFKKVPVFFGAGLPGGGEDATGPLLDCIRRSAKPRQALADCIEAFKASDCTSQQKIQGLEMLRLEELCAVLSHAVSHEVKIQRKSTTWPTAVMVASHQRQVAGLAAEVHNAMLTHMLLHNKVAPVQRDETWSDRFGRLESFFADMKETNARVKPQGKSPVVMDQYLRSLPKQVSNVNTSMASMASPWPQKDSLHERSLNERSLQGLDSLGGSPSSLTSSLSWKDRSAKSRCSAATNIWEWSQHVPPLATGAYSPSAASSGQERMRTKSSGEASLPPIFPHDATAIHFDEADVDSLNMEKDGSPLTGGSMAAGEESPKRRHSYLDVFPNLAKRTPMPTRRLIFDDQPASGGGKRKKQERFREMTIHSGRSRWDRERESTVATADLIEAQRLLEVGSSSSSKPASEKALTRGNSLVRSSSDTALLPASPVEGFDLSQRLVSNRMSEMPGKGFVEKLMSLDEEEFEDELWRDREPDGRDPAPDRVFDRTFKRDFSVPVMAPVQQLSPPGRVSEQGLPSILNKGSYWDPQRETKGGYAPHVIRYLQTCSNRRIIPDLLPFITGHSQKLEAPGRRLSDRDLSAIASIVQSSPDVNFVDLSNNGLLTDKSVAPLLEAMMQQPPPAILTHMNLSMNRGLGSQTALKLAELVEIQAGSRLKVLKINNLHLGVASQMPLCAAIKEHSCLREVHMADTRLKDRECLMTLLANNTIEVFDLGWNCFHEDSFEVMGELVAQNDALHSLSLCSCAAAPKPEEVTPIASFLEWLASNSGLQHLDLSLNRIDFRGALVIEDALQRHKKLSRLNMSHNPLGILGMRSMLRLLSVKQSAFIYFDCEGCNCEQEKFMLKFDQVFRAMDPGGPYELDFCKPYHRALLRMLCRTAERLKINLADAFTATVGTFTPPTKNAQGYWDVPNSGELKVTFNVEKGLCKDPSKRWNFVDLLQNYRSALRVRPGLAKAVRLLTQWESMKGREMDQLTFLGALAKDFVLQAGHVVQMCRAREVASEVVWRLFPCIDKGQAGRFLVLLSQPAPGFHVVALRRAAKFLSFNAENPTGHYRLDLSNPTDFFLAQRLMLLDRWEIATRLELKRADTSRRGTNSCCLNERYQEMPFVEIALARWKLPENGVFEFDYVTGKRPLETEKPVTEATLQRLHHALCCCEASPLEQVQSALRRVSHLICLSCEQLRTLLGVYDNAPARADLFVLFYLRLVDIQNDKIMRVAFDDRQEEFAAIQHRLGACTSFPFIQPEQFSFEYDLAFADHRLASLIVFKLCEAEHPDNLKDPTFVSKGGAEDEANFWRSSKEADIEKMPTQGIFKGKYMCAPEDRDFKTRTKLLETYAFWQISAGENQVRWWASLTEAPADVLDFAEWLFPRYTDIAKAFHDIDGSVEGGSVSNGSITAKEFDEGLKALGFTKLGPSGINTVFRYLDPTGEGCISQGEWLVLGLLLQEMQLSLKEFVNFLLRTVGETLEEWWRALDEDENKQVSYSEWTRLCRRLGFFGATKQIFKFMDKDDTGTISFREFKALEIERKALEAARNSSKMKPAKFGHTI